MLIRLCLHEVLQHPERQNLGPLKSRPANASLQTGQEQSYSQPGVFKSEDAAKRKLFFLCLSESSVLATSELLPIVLGPNPGFKNAREQAVRFHEELPR